MEAGAWIQRCWANSKAEESRLCNYCQEKNRHKKGKNNLYSTKKVILNNKSLILPGSYKT